MPTIVTNEKSPPDHLPQDLISTRAAADLVGVTVNTVRVWIYKGELPAWRCVGLWKVSRADVLALFKPPALPLQTKKQAAKEKAWVKAEMKKHGIG